MPKLKIDDCVIADIPDDVAQMLVEIIKHDRTGPINFRALDHVPEKPIEFPNTESGVTERARFQESGSIRLDLEY